MHVVFWDLIDDNTKHRLETGVRLETLEHHFKKRTEEGYKLQARVQLAKIVAGKETSWISHLYNDEDLLELRTSLEKASAWNKNRQQSFLMAEAQYQQLLEEEADELMSKESKEAKRGRLSKETREESVLKMNFKDIPLSALVASPSAPGESVKEADSSKQRPIDAVTPRHYKAYLPANESLGIQKDLQWIDAVLATDNFRDPAKIEGAIEIMVRKYIDRAGKKDGQLQDLKKAKWYLEYWIAFVSSGKKPIRIDDHK